MNSDNNSEYVMVLFEFFQNKLIVKQIKIKTNYRTLYIKNNESKFMKKIRPEI